MRLKSSLKSGVTQLALVGCGVPAIGLAVLLFVVSFAFAPDMSPHPTDEELIANWSANRQAFEELCAMFQADCRLGRVAPDFTRPGDPGAIGISSGRIRDYRRRCSKLDLESGIEGYDEKSTIWFHASSQGLSVTGSGKGYVYTTERPALVVPSLDAYWSADGRSFTAYRHLEGNWYLYLDYED